MAFFRHRRPRAARFIAFKAQVFAQAGAPWIGNACFVRNLLVAYFPVVSRTQEGNPFGRAHRDHHILVGVSLLAHTVMQGLFVGVFRTLAPSLSAINDPVTSVWPSTFLPGHLGPVSLWCEAQLLQGRLYYWQEAMNPEVGLGLAQAEQLALHDLQRIGLLIDENEQQARFGCVQVAVPSTARLALMGFAAQRLSGRKAFPVCLNKRRYQDFEFSQRQSGQGQEASPLSFQLVITQHHPSIFLFPIKSIGPDPVQPKRFAAEPESTALQVVARSRNAAPEVADQDIAALQALKDVLRGLVWAEQAVTDDKSVDLALFFTDLVGAIDAATYRLPIRPDREEILVTHVIQPRGVAFRAVAVLGLAEGEFPAAIHEDTFLRDSDRSRLRKESKFALDLSTESSEIEYFYETVTRPWERMLLTRPRLADNGAPWQASPFWEEVRRLLSLTPTSLQSGAIPQGDRAASWPEFVESLSAHAPTDDIWKWAQQQAPERLAALQTSTHLFRSRADGDPSPFDGDLGSLSTDFADRFSPDRTWSASRLEKYRTCPYLFFVGSVLGLEPREKPVEGLDRRQLGNIYHHILKQVYEAPGVGKPPDLEQLVSALDSVAARVLDEAPKQEGFRETAWWQQTRIEIVENLRRSLRALTELSREFVPIVPEGLEAGFDGPHTLVVIADQDSFRVHGIIDRIDRDAVGHVRIIDYKTSGPTSFDSKALIEGKKLQVPLYALAAQDALGLEEISEGFYWHVIQAEASGFQLSEFEGGPEAAIAIAVVKSWEAVRGARSGRFAPSPPDDGCPDYCPAAAFCWHFQPGFRG